MHLRIVGLRTAVGAILIIYGIIGLAIQFIPIVSSYYEGVLSSFSDNHIVSSFLGFFDPFNSSLLETELWFGLAFFLGIIILAYRSLVTQEKPQWLQPGVS